MEVHHEDGESNAGAQFIAPTSPLPPQGTRQGQPYHTTKPPTTPVYGRGTPGGYPAGGDHTTKPPTTPVYGRDTPCGYPAGGYPTCGYPTCGYPASRYPAGGYPTRGYPVSQSEPLHLDAPTFHTLLK